MRRWCLTVLNLLWKHLTTMVMVKSQRSLKILKFWSN